MLDRAGRLLPLVLVALLISFCGPAPVAGGAAPTLSTTAPHAVSASDCGEPSGVEIGLPTPTNPLVIAPDLVGFSGSPLEAVQTLPVEVIDLRQRSRDVRGSRAPPRA